MKRTKPPATNADRGGAKVTTLSMSEITRRMLYASQLGSQYGGDRNVYQALGYPTSIEFSEYAGRYARQDMAKAVIDRPISYTWKGPVQISEAGKETETELEKAWGELEDRLKIKSMFVRLDKLSSIGAYGVLLLGFSDTATKEDFKKPITAGTGLELAYVKPLAENHAGVETWIENPKDPKFGKPELYKVTLTMPGNGKTDSMLVHTSRILHVAPELLENDIEGVPPLESIWNRLMDLEKLVGGSAEMFWRGARPGYQAKVDADATLPTDVEADLQNQIDEFENNLRRVLVNEGVSFEALEAQVSNPEKHVDVVIQMISAVTGIPKRILTGSERGELSSSQDITSFLSLVTTRREEYAEPSIVRPFVDKLIEYKVLPAATDERYDVEWRDLFSMSDEEKAKVGKTRADALSVYGNNPILEAVVTPEQFLEIFVGLTDEQIEKIVEARNAAVGLEPLLTPEETEMIEEEENNAPPAQEEDEE